MTEDDPHAELARLRAENEHLKRRQTRDLHLKVSAKGALSVSPTDVEGTMKTLHEAITMAPEERRRRAELLSETVRQQDIHHWLTRQLEDIKSLL